MCQHTQNVRLPTAACYCCYLTITTDRPIFTSFPSPVWCRCLVSPEAPFGHSSSPLAPPAVRQERCALSPASLAPGGWSGTRGSCPWRCDYLPRTESPTLSIQQVMTTVREDAWGVCTLFEDDRFSDLLPINISLSPNQWLQSDHHCRGKTHTAASGAETEAVIQAENRTHGGLKERRQQRPTEVAFCTVLGCVLSEAFLP